MIFYSNSDKVSFQLNGQHKEVIDIDVVYSEKHYGSTGTPCRSSGYNTTMGQYYTPTAVVIDSHLPR